MLDLQSLADLARDVRAELAFGGNAFGAVHQLDIGLQLGTAESIAFGLRHARAVYRRSVEAGGDGADQIAEIDAAIGAEPTAEDIRATIVAAGLTEPTEAELAECMTYARGWVCIDSAIQSLSVVDGAKTGCLSAYNYALCLLDAREDVEDALAAARIAEAA